MSRADRLINLYSTIGLNTANGTINRAEIMAYCAGMDMLDDMIKVIIDEKHIGKPVSPEWETLYADIDDQSFDLSYSRNFVCVYTTNYEKIGIVVQNWFSPFCKVILNGDGLPWSKLDKSWREIHKRAYRWSIINTMVDTTEV